MSYCRWSSADFACDLYCYYSDQGYETHVAANRVVGSVPHVDYMAPIDEVKLKYNAQSKFLANCTHEAIDLPHAGDTFVDLTLVDFDYRLRYLRQVGYRFPDQVFERIWAERAEEVVDAVMADDKLLEIIHKQFPVLPNDSLIMGKLFAVADEISSIFRDRLEAVYESNCRLSFEADELNCGEPELSLEPVE